MIAHANEAGSIVCDRKSICSSALSGGGSHKPTKLEASSMTENRFSLISFQPLEINFPMLGSVVVFCALSRSIAVQNLIRTVFVVGDSLPHLCFG